MEAEGGSGGGGGGSDTGNPPSGVDSPLIAFCALLDILRRNSGETGCPEKLLK